MGLDYTGLALLAVGILLLLVGAFLIVLAVLATFAFAEARVRRRFRRGSSGRPPADALHPAIPAALPGQPSDPRPVEGSGGKPLIF